jgi:hypothetical protein
MTSARFLPSSALIRQFSRISYTDSGSRPLTVISLFGLSSMTQLLLKGEHVVLVVGWPLAGLTWQGLSLTFPARQAQRISPAKCGVRRRSPSTDPEHSPQTANGVLAPFFQPSLAQHGETTPVTRTGVIRFVVGKTEFRPIQKEHAGLMRMEECRLRNLAVVLEAPSSFTVCDRKHASLFTASPAAEVYVRGASPGVGGAPGKGVGVPSNRRQWRRLGGGMGERSAPGRAGKRGHVSYQVWKQRRIGHQVYPLKRWNCRCKEGPCGKADDLRDGRNPAATHPVMPSEVGMAVESAVPKSFSGIKGGNRGPSSRARQRSEHLQGLDEPRSELRAARKKNRSQIPNL